MKEEIILALFYSDETNLVYEKIRDLINLPQDSKEQLKMLLFKFLDPVFLAEAADESTAWKIEKIEANLSQKQDRYTESEILQSFFTLNSTMKTKDGLTNLFSLIGSPNTEDIDFIFNKIANYIHPSLTIGNYVNQRFNNDGTYKKSRYIEDELNRGLKLVEYSLGLARKMHWKEQKKYYCIGLIEKSISENETSSALYTFNEDSQIRKSTLDFIPSYYVLVILPDFYENLINETLQIFRKTTLFSNIKEVDIMSENKKVRYIEEFITQSGFKKSYGAILLGVNDEFEDIKGFSFFRKLLRNALDSGKELSELLPKFNKDLIRFRKWGIKSESDLNEIKMRLDGK